MSHIFCKCSSFTSLPDISKWNAKNVFNICEKFNKCSSLLSLPEFQNGILKMFLIYVRCLINAHHYHLYLIFQNGILIMIIISLTCLMNVQILFFKK